MDKLEMIRQVVDDILRQQPDKETRRCGFVHLYGVSSICALLAIKRGLDPQLCAIAGMLHDIWSYKTGNSIDHALPSAQEAERIIKAADCFIPEEIALICEAIAHHSAKERRDGEVDELLKDADVMQHYLYNPPTVMHEPEPNKVLDAKSTQWILRLTRVFNELGLVQNNMISE